MQIKRTSNSGILLVMDGVKILLDGVSKELHPYMGTPEGIRRELEADLPHILAFTHMHDDHYDDSFAQHYKKITQRTVYSPEKVCSVTVSNVRLEMIQTRHIGKTDELHVSYCLDGSKCVWFMGDASPLSLKRFENMKSPDVLIAPFSFANTPLSWEAAKKTGAEKIVILHLPKKENDTYDLWNTVLKTTAGDEHLIIPDIGQTIFI